MAPGILIDTHGHSTPSSSPRLSPATPEETTTFNNVLEPIAIIGMGCRLPGDVDGPAAFWDLMINKNTGRTPKVPSSRFNIDAHFHENTERPGSFDVLGGYFLKSDLQEFDPVPFGVSPVEAMWMDPQQRKLLEVVYEAFENSGSTLDDVSGTVTAVFAGSFTSDFQQMSFKEPDFRHSYAATGVDPGIISNRISHVFNLHGPSITVNTACSSSVYALHNACNALRNGECEGAVVGGVNLILTVDQHMNTAKLGVLSPDSTCHTFDESANGYGRADGVGAVYIKRLSDAVRNGDPVRAVITSSAVNSNGKAPAVGITHPNRQGQTDVIRAAYRRANLDPLMTGYFECHGTGTSIGDPLEVHAVAEAMTKNRKHGDKLMIGAVKTNIGHSEAASGLSAVIKACLAVEKGIIPPTRGLVKPNPKIQWDDWRVKVVTEPTYFPASLPLRRVSVNSFGYGGTNGHVIIDNVDSVVPGYRPYKSIQESSESAANVFDEEPDRSHLLAFSAYDKATLKRSIDSYSKTVSKVDLLDVAYTLNTRRSKLPYRAFAICKRDSAQADTSSALESISEKGDPVNVAFAFTGQGAQWPRMGAELIRHYPSFAQTIEQLDAVLAKTSEPPSWSIKELLLESPSTSRVDDAQYSQPLCTAVQVAIVKLLARWNVNAVATVGHSSGEIAAAYAAGSITAETAIIAAYYRGKAISLVKTDGAMLAAGLGAEKALEYLQGYEQQIVVACHNSPASVTLSGDAPAIHELKQRLDADGVFARVVKTSGKAYHSHHMKEVAQTYERLMKRDDHLMGTPYHQTRKVDMISSVTGFAMGKRAVNAAYWSANLANPVLFNQAFACMAKSNPSINMVVEIGPHSVLSSFIRDICASNGLPKMAYASSLVRNTNDADQLLKLAGTLWAKDSSIALDQVSVVEHTLADGSIEEIRGSLLVDLPNYPWNYSKTLWAEPRQSQEHRAPKYARHDILGSRIPGLTGTEPLWRNVMRQKDVPWLRDHTLGGQAIFPAAGYFSMAMEAITQLSEITKSPEISAYTLRDVSIKTALVVPDDDDGIETVLSLRTAEINSKVSPDSVVGKWFDFNVYSYSREDDTWKDHIAGTIGVNMRSKVNAEVPPPMQLRTSGKAWNQRLRDVGFDYGPTFQDMDDIRSDGTHYEAIAKTALKQSCGIIAGESRHVIHPGTVDSCLQLIIVSIYAGRLNDVTCGAVPIQLDEVTIWTPTSSQLANSQASAYSWTHQRGNRSFLSGSQLVASDGDVLMNLSDMRCVAYEAAVPQQAQNNLEPQPYMQMVYKPDIDHLDFSVHSKSVSQSTARDLLEIMVHKNAALKVLDFDAQTTSMGDLAKSQSLDYTVVASSEDALNSLQDLFKDHQTVKTIQVDSYDDLVGQGVQESHYDAIIASKDMDAKSETLRHCLAPGGRLLTHGATGSEVLSSTASNNSEDQKTEKESVLLVYREQSTSLVQSLSQLCTQRGWNVRSSLLGDIQGPRSDDEPVERVVMLAEIDDSLLISLEQQELTAIQTLVDSSKSVLWVTTGSLLKGNSPHQAMASGLARSLRSENVSLDLVTLDFDTQSVDSAQMAKTVTEILATQAKGTEEKEYFVQDNTVYISRLVPSQSCNERFASQGNVESTQFTTNRALSGTLRSGKVLFQDDELRQAPLLPDFAEIEIKAVGLNREDVLVVTGSDYPTTFSHEIYGAVTAVGSDVKHLAVGDRVVGFCFDKFGTHQRTPANLVEKVGARESDQRIASLPMAYATAIYGLTDLARIQARDVVLILDGTGAAGLAAIQICRVIKAQVLIVTQSEDDLSFLQTVGASPDEVIHCRNEEVAAQVYQRTNKHGVDAIFSCSNVDPDVARECWRAIAPLGRFIDFGRKDVLRRKVLDTLPLNRGANFFSFDLLEIYKSKPEILSSLLKQCLDMYNAGLISAVEPTQLRDVSQLNDAIQVYSDKFSAGKVVISYEPNASTIEVLPSRPKLRLQADATYFLVGCLGGLGRSLTTWMIERGAKHLAFMSRSGADSRSAAALIESIEARGVTATVIRGDVTAIADVKAAVKEAGTVHPVRGVVHAAMVLEDGMFRTMNIGNWKTVIGPKVKGAMNLHEAFLDSKLDFFVMTSSTSGILGTPGQSNYAAGNTFLDSLARHRRSLGLPGVSLVLPMVLGVGYVAEHPEVEEALRRKGIYGIDEDELLASFEVSMLLQRDSKNDIDHVVVGLEPAKLAASIGHSDTTDAFWIEDARFRSVVAAAKGADVAGGAASGNSIIATIKSAGSDEAAIAAVTEYLIQRLARLLLIDAADFDPEERSIASYGLDSMIGTEFRNWLFREFQVDVPFQQLLGSKLTISKFATDLCAKHR